jgi:hypothetical protein
MLYQERDMSIKDMPYVTVEQVLALRAAAVALEDAAFDLLEHSWMPVGQYEVNYSTNGVYIRNLRAVMERES